MPHPAGLLGSAVEEAMLCCSSSRLVLPAAGRTVEGDQGTGRGGREASETTALAQLRKMRVSPNHSGWGHAGCCTPPPPSLPGTLQVHSGGNGLLSLDYNLTLSHLPLTAALGFKSNCEQVQVLAVCRPRWGSQRG